MSPNGPDTHHPPQELDFCNEALNAARCAVNFGSPQSRVRDRVAVPTVYPMLSSSRVLTMEFMDGCGVTDLVALKAAGLKASDVRGALVSGAHRLRACIRVQGLGFRVQGIEP